LIGRTTIILSAVLGLTGCAVATGSRDSAPIASSYRAASISWPRIGSSAAGDRASVSGPVLSGRAAVHGLSWYRGRISRSASAA